MSETEDYIEELRSQIARDVASGFAERDDIATNAVEYMEGTEGAPDDLLALAEKLVNEAWAVREAEELTWGTAPTDCDRLDHAFTALEAAGIVARQNFTCCQTCGHAEIRDEVEGEPDGYAFYHQQDTDSAVEGGGVMLAFGTFGEGDPLAIGHRVAEALKAHGLRVDWNGSVDRRIHVQLTWRRRTTSLS